MGVTVALLWLGRIGPPLLKGGVPVGLDSYTTLVIQALDMGVVAPTAMLAGVLLWQKRPFGYLLAAVMLLKGVTMLTAVSAMAVGMLLANVEVSAVELVVFPTFNLLVIIATIVLLRGVVEQPKKARTSESSTERTRLASAALR